MVHKYVPAVALALLMASTARAQDEVPQGEFNVERFSPAIGPGNYFAVDGAQVVGHLVPSAGLHLSYGLDPFVIREAECTPGDETDCEAMGPTNEPDGHLVHHLFTLYLHGTLTLIDRIQLGIVWPLSISSGETFDFTRGGSPVELPGGTGVGGDPRLTVKVGIWDQGGDGLGLAAAGFVSAPLGQVIGEDRYVGDDLPTGGVHLIGEFISHGFHVAANIGGVFRKRVTLFSTEHGSRLTYGLAFGYDVTPLIMVFGELNGESSFSSEVDENPMEARAGARLRVGDFSFSLGAGGGILAGVGTPLFRVVAGAQWAPIRADQDGDDVMDADDGCPDDPEDADEWLDDDGCPEADNDEDEFVDADDQCPIEAEDRDEYQDEDGCPDPDNDGDNVRDGFDACPMEPEDVDDDRDEDGCPDADTDRDGIDDVRDACPEAAEDTDGFGDDDGCPEDDFDGDGVNDDMDECPDQAESMNGIEDENGCPEEDQDSDTVPDAADRCPDQAETVNGTGDEDGCPDGEALVVIEGDQIRLVQPIAFVSNRATIQGRNSNRVLDSVAFVLNRNPQYRRVRVEGHTDDRGDRDANVRLSEERAAAVVAALTQRGVAAARLQAVGLGPDRPAGSNDTPEGREQNRRIELHIETAPPGAR